MTNEVGIKINRVVINKVTGINVLKMRLGKSGN